MTLLIAIVVSALAGFISLSYEILWFRAFSFATGGKADTFGVLLGAFLLGLAFGARFAEQRFHAQERPGEAATWETLASACSPPTLLRSS